MKIGEFLKEKRLQRNLSLRQVAYKTGLSHTYISDIEKGNLLGTNETQEKIMMALNFTEEEKNLFYTLLIEDDSIPNFITEKMNKFEVEIEQLKKENEQLKNNSIVQNNHNNGDVVIGKNEKHYYNSTNDELDLSELDEKDIEDVKKYIEFLKNKKLIKI